jgi:lactate racemase
MNFHIPYSGSEMAFSVPWGADLADFNLPDLPPVDLQVPALDIGDCTKALIVFTDATRHSPDQWFAQHILSALPLPLDRIRFLCATGMHRASTHAEKIEKLGREIVERYEVLDHDANSVVTVGQIDGINVEVNPLLVEPGTYLVMTGVVEPHQYAGYSGGAKTAVIGCGGAGTISYTHGPALLDQPGVRLGVIQNNPFQDYVRRAGALIGVNLIANCIMPTDDKIVAAAVGGIEVHDELVAIAQAYYEVAVPNAPYDVVIAGVGAPKDANLYQASRAATYLGLSGTPVIRPGGVIIIAAALPEGAGAGAGEQNFFSILERMGPTEALIHHLREHGCLPGEQRAYMIAQLMAQYRCIVVGATDTALVEQVGLSHAPNVESALKMASDWLGVQNPKTLVVPHALKVLPKPA